MNTGASSNRVVTRTRSRSAQAAFSLPEVIVAMVLVTLMCVSVFPGMQLVSRSAINTAIRSEAHRLMQAEVERLTFGTYSAFTASADQTITSAIKTTFGPDKHQRLQYPSSQAGRVVFTRRVVEVSSTSKSRSLRVEVQWVWQGRAIVISTPLFRST